MINETEVQEAPPEKKLECKRCGQCCSQIVLPISPLRLKRKYLIWKGWHDNARRGRKNTETRRTARDIWLLYPMLIPIGEAPEFEKITQSGDYQSEKNICIGANTLLWRMDIKPDMCASYGRVSASESKAGFNSYYPNCVWLS